MTAIKPLLRWAGGKRKLVPTILAHMPDSYRRYHEPFLGGGAVFFGMPHGGTEAPMLSDVNEDLVNAYGWVRDQPLILADSLAAMANTPEVYARVRAEEPASAVGRAVRFLYLNMTCFNGLYRVNRAGKFNVPYGKRKLSLASPDVRSAIFVTSAFLRQRGAHVRRLSFVEAGEDVQEGDVVYCDPPYVPLSKTSSFTAYDGDGFGSADHERLAACARTWALRGATVLLSNADAPWVRATYFALREEIPRVTVDLHAIEASRSIAADGEKRGKVGELLICIKKEIP